MKSRIIYHILFICLGASLIISCKHNEDQAIHHSVMQTIKSHNSDSVTKMNIEDLMQDIKKVLADVPDSAREFYVLERQSVLTSFPCSNCHNVPLGQLQFQNKEDKKAHWDINIVHTRTDMMNCNTCHEKKDLNKIRLINGTTITFDESYKQCAQCHSTQYKDWIGGTHGKRVKGWGEPRVINNCVNCHNPHRPAISARWPARLNTQKLKERDGE